MYIGNVGYLVKDNYMPYINRDLCTHASYIAHVSTWAQKHRSSQLCVLVPVFSLVHEWEAISQAESTCYDLSLVLS